MYNHFNEGIFLSILCLVNIEAHYVQVLRQDRVFNIETVGLDLHRYYCFSPIHLGEGCFPY